jgi:hypothetical protein
VVGLGNRHSVQAGEALITNCRQVHVGSFFGDLDSLEFCIMEVISICYIFLLCWVNGVSYLSKVAFIILSFLLGLVDVTRW